VREKLESPVNFDDLEADTGQGGDPLSKSWG
jgi:hypothetical protein